MPANRQDMTVPCGPAEQDHLDHGADSAPPSVAAFAKALGATDPAGNEAAIRDILARMVRVAERLVKNRDDAWDCAQEALIRGLRKFEQFEGRSSITSWLFRITINCALQHLKARARRGEVSIDHLLPTFDRQEFQVATYMVTEDTAEDILSRADAKKQVLDAINALPDTYRTALLLRDIEELSIRETASLLDVTETAAKVRVHRARTALRKLLEPLVRSGAL